VEEARFYLRADCGQSVLQYRRTHALSRYSLNFDRALASDPSQARNSFRATTNARKHMSHSVIGPEGPLNSSPKALKENAPFSFGDGGNARSKIATMAKADIAAQGSPIF
jgi:hypothetical protein